MRGDTLQLGQEWLVDAGGCDVAALKDPVRLSGLFEALIIELGLTVIGQPQWHTFPGPGGITGLALLSESHLAIHTFPEHGYAALSVYSCRGKAAPSLEALVKKALGASSITVRTLTREVPR